MTPDAAALAARTLDWLRGERPQDRMVHDQALWFNRTRHDPEGIDDGTQIWQDHSPVMVNHLAEVLATVDPAEHYCRTTCCIAGYVAAATLQGTGYDPARPPTSPG